MYQGDELAWEDEITRLNGLGVRLVAHNGRFDFRILKLQYGIVPAYMGDTMLMARHLGFQKCSLDVLAKHLLGEGKSEGIHENKRLCDLTTEQFSAMASYNAKDVELTEKLYEKVLPYFPKFELSLIEQTLRLTLKEHEIDWQRLACAEAAVAEDSPIAMQSDLAKELMPIRTSPAAVRKFILERAGVDPLTIDKNKVVLENLPEEARKILQTVWRMRSNLRSETMIGAMAARTVDQRTRKAYMDMNYSKAVTHRWSSGGEDSKSFNIQNMTKGSGIRELWVPEKGTLYAILDLAQIEARVVSWYANEEPLLGAFREGLDCYCEFGLHVFGHVLDKRREETERQICKQAVLGLGFGMGAKKFNDRMMLMCPKALTSVTEKLGYEHTIDAARKIVQIYRRAYPRIANMAPSFYNLYVSASGGRCGEFVGVGVRYDEKMGKLTTKLPTGGVLTYRNFGYRTVDSRFNPGTQELELFYGDKILTYSTPFENVVQSTARDILGRKLLALESDGFDLRFHSHDEVILQVPEYTAVTRLERAKDIFSSPVECCPGLPLSCSGFLSDRYTKDEKYMYKFTSKFMSKR